jgi:hypothetical protein
MTVASRIRMLIAALDLPLGALGVSASVRLGITPGDAGRPPSPGFRNAIDRGTV